MVCRWVSILGRGISYHDGLGGVLNGDLEKKRRHLKKNVLKRRGCPNSDVSAALCLSSGRYVNLNFGIGV